jgi:ATP-dependent helicase IRC3
MSDKSVHQFYGEYNLTTARKHPTVRIPAGHQSSALEKLHHWFSERSDTDKGGILVLPTGGGKTFTAMRFLCAGPLSQGYRVLWLAHTHHLLEQAMESLVQEMSHISGSKSKLAIRVVSGTIGHCRVHEIKPGDDVVIGTLQTITQADRNQHPQLVAFLREAGEKLCIVFDEAHHSPAYSYRTLITNLRKRHPRMLLLGLTATPTYTDEQKRGLLKNLFPQGILHQVQSQELMAAGILAKPIFEDHRTDFSMEFDEQEYNQWRSTYRDIPEDIITQLAQSRERNLFIAQTYIDNKDRYGKTIIFADRWFQCEQIREFLRNRDRTIRVDAIYTHIDAHLGSPEARNRRTADENKRVLEAFRQNELDVLINIRMLTEGTDVPSVNTVFLTRQTTSSILLTQMIGRALRGPRFGGTENAYIVSFIDDWKHLINWADYNQLTEGDIDPGGKPAYIKAVPLQYISIELIRRLSAQMDTGENINIDSFLSMLPVGWYRIDFETLVKESDDQEVCSQMIMVFDTEEESYQKYIELIKKLDIRAFEDTDISMDDHREQLIVWQQRSFLSEEKRASDKILTNLFHIARHIAQNRTPPKFFPFEERNHHDLDAIARRFIDADLGPKSEHDSLQVEYNRQDRYWSIIHPRYELFWSHYQACKGRELGLGSHRVIPPKPDGIEISPDRELSDALKRQVKARDNHQCLCCGKNNTLLLQVDHITPSYLGGTNDLDNLQTLCDRCNSHKGGVKKIDFRHHSTLLSTPPTTFPEFELFKQPIVTNNTQEWDRLLRQSINFFYQCAAVESVKIGERGNNFHQWEILLYAGNDPRWLTPYVKPLLQRIQKQWVVTGWQGPDGIVISQGVHVVQFSTKQSNK